MAVPPGRRLAVLLIALALIAIPPVVSRALCLGETCAGSGGTAQRIPFCPLPGTLKTLIADGFRSGRSPDVLGVTDSTVLAGGNDPSLHAIPWPAVNPAPDTHVPIALFGNGVDATKPLPGGTGLDQIAPSLSEILGFSRSHPEVRAGVAVPGIASGSRPRLLVEIVWKGVGTPDLQAMPRSWPYLRGLFDRGGAVATLDGVTGSVPLDPAATLTTIGTGGLPYQHGITGTFIRNARGSVTRAWGRGSPPSVISTLPDDLDFRLHEAPKIGLVAPDLSDRGVIGGTWYVPHDSDDVIVGAGDPVAAGLLRAGYGADATPDVLAVVLDGSVARMDARTRGIVSAVRASGVPAAFVVTATGTSAPVIAGVGDSVARAVDATAPRPIVEASVPGGIFLDQGALAASGLSSNAAVDAMLAMPDRGEKLFADAFPGFAVSFARYC